MKIMVYLCLSVGLALLLLNLSLQISPKGYDSEKLSAYECGFTPLGDARQPFHIRFYLVGILFLLFDFEVIFLFPWAVSMHNFAHSLAALSTVLIFLLLLTIGFVYEWKKGALDWE
jgi:NADH-quinone oxidoreductase subunit A